MSALTKTSNKVTETLNDVPVHLFRWRDSLREFHSPCDMETRHLFYTLRMIWNHSMPEADRLQPFKHYRFSSFYTPQYMSDAIIAIGKELFNRTDLLPEWKAQLDFMASRFAKMKPLLKDQKFLGYDHD